MRRTLPRFTRREFSLADEKAVPLSFITTSLKGLLRALVNECKVSEAWDPKGTAPQPTLHSFRCLWDTGATHSMISEDVTKACGLTPTGFGDSHHAQGTTKSVPIFLVNIMLPNNVGVVGVPVMQGAFAQFDVLIGMDIITRGDFAVTNLGGKTKFSFRIPSQASINFVTEDQEAAILSRQSSPSQRTRERNRRKRKGKKSS